MVDINLLPEELRKKEEKEKEAAKKPREFVVKMSAPGENGVKSLKQADKTFTPPKKAEEFPVMHRQPFREEIYKEAAKLAEEKAKSAEFPKSGGIRFPPPKAVSKDIHTKPEEKFQDIKKMAPRAFGKPEKKPEPPKVKAVPKLTSDIYQFGKPKVRRNFWDILKLFFKIFSFRKKEKKPAKAPDSGKIAGTLAVLPKVLPKPELKSAPEIKPEIKKEEPELKPFQVVEVKAAPPAPAPKEMIEKKAALPATAAKPAEQLKREGEKQKKEKNFFRDIGINLIPEDILRKSFGTTAKKKFIALILSFFASILLVGLVYGGLRFYEERIGSEIQAIDASIADKKIKISEYEKDRTEAFALQSKLDLLKGILKNHVHWTRVFEELEKYTVEDVYFTSFTASHEGNLTLAAIGKDYTSVARQLVTFQEAKDFTVFVQINSASARSQKEKNKVEIQETFFTVNLKMNPKIFFKEIKL